MDPHSKILEWGEKEKDERPKRRRRDKAKTRRSRIRLEWALFPGDMLMSSLENGKEAHLVVLDNFKQLET